MLHLRNILNTPVFSHRVSPFNSTRSKKVITKHIYTNLINRNSRNRYLGAQDGSWLTTLYIMRKVMKSYRNKSTLLSRARHNKRIVKQTTKPYRYVALMRQTKPQLPPFHEYAEVQITGVQIDSVYFNSLIYSVYVTLFDFIYLELIYPL